MNKHAMPEMEQGEEMNKEMYSIEYLWVCLSLGIILGLAIGLMIERLL
jgi:hypothetical protein